MVLANLYGLTCLAHAHTIPEGLDVVWNALLAPFILKEKLTRPAPCRLAGQLFKLKLKLQMASTTSTGNIIEKRRLSNVVKRLSCDAKLCFWGTGSLEAFWWCPAQLAQPFLEIRRTEAATTLTPAHSSLFAAQFSERRALAVYSKTTSMAGSLDMTGCT